MIECPNCGHQNADSRAFCEICGERLPPPVPTVVQPAPPEVIAEPPPAPANDGLEKPVADISFLLNPAEEATPDAPPAPEPSAPANAFLPAWLQGLETEPEPKPVPLPPPDWTDALDFSDLPEWTPDAEAAPPAATPTPPTSTATRQPAPPWSDEIGTGLLAGIPGLIPQQPPLQLSSNSVSVPQETEGTSDTAAAANLFTQIASGGITPEVTAPAVQKRRGCSPLHLLLQLAVAVPLVLGLLLGQDRAIFGAPAQLPVASAYSATVAALPNEATVLLAFDYDGSLRDDVEPGVVATLNHLRTLTMDDTATPRDLNLVALSLSPQGPALAENAWAASQGQPQAWTNLGFLSGGPVALRTLLSEQNLTLDSTALLIIFANDTADMQGWLEQVGTQRPEMPILAVTPASAETPLMPYLASGQLDGLVAGLPGAASYEVSGSGHLGAGWRRVHALTAGSLLALGVVIVAQIGPNGRKQSA